MGGWGTDLYFYSFQLYKSVLTTIDGSPVCGLVKHLHPYRVGKSSTGVKVNRICLCWVAVWSHMAGDAP